MNTERIVILDLGSQFNQLVARRVRESGVYSELLPHGASFAGLGQRLNVCVSMRRGI